MSHDLTYWPDFYKAPDLIINRQPILSSDAPIFTMGSCFAQEIRTAFQSLGVRALPDYASVYFDRTAAKFDDVPTVKDFTPHYDTFVMRQEFEAAFGVWPDRSVGFWEIRNLRANDVLKWPVAYQDPYRKINYAANRETLENLADNITAKIREGIDASPVLILTLGLTEVWRHDATGRYLCRPAGSAGGGGKGLATFRQSTFQENYENMRAICDLVFSHYPEKKMVLSVSPVPLERTFSGTDIGTANMESKSILRAVASQIAREYAGRVSYFPSYDAAFAARVPDVFEADGRHVTKKFAGQMVDLFLRVYKK